MGHHSAVDLLDRSSFTLPTMNIVVWNCRGALKAKFKQTMADLINWHKPVVMIITETRVNSFRAEEVIQGLPFDGFAMSETIGFAGGNLATLEFLLGSSGSARSD